MLKKSDFKEKFIERYEKLTDFDRFQEFSSKYLRRSIRVNTLKIKVEDLIKRLQEHWNLDPVPWCKEGFWIENTDDGRRDLGNLLEHTLGYIYIQEAASMIPPLVLGPKPGEHILDMCSSPGSKSTQICQYMENKGILICNDIKKDRMKPLSLNLQRVGATNAVATMMLGHKIKNLEFDRILVDAPCSGTGTIRKSFKTLKIWNPNMVKRLSATQKQLITTAFKMLKPGGTLVYSTCTCEPEENEGVISHLLNMFDEASIQKIDLPIVRSHPVTAFEGTEFRSEVKDCLRIWPQDNDTEGFFVTKIEKAL